MRSLSKCDVLQGARKSMKINVENFSTIPRRKSEEKRIASVNYEREGSALTDNLSSFIKFN